MAVPSRQRLGRRRVARRDRVIFIRSVWSDITPNAAHFEQSFSDDGGKTWEVNWIADQTRLTE
jgi:hypothetical protein